MTRIGITCDFLRFEIDSNRPFSFQARNLAWLAKLLTGGDAWRAHGLVAEVVSPPTDPEQFRALVGSPIVWAEYQEEPNLAWARRYEHRDTLDGFDAWLDRIGGFDLLIGFELPPSVRACLHSRGVRYVNVHIHALRFLRDVCFWVSTNIPAAGAVLRALTVPPAEITRQVQRFGALLARRRPAACAMPPHIPLLAGQTEFDSVLIHRGRFASWSEYESELRELLHEHDEVVLLEHPARRDSIVIGDFIRAALGKSVIVTNANSYGVLFASPDPGPVLTLSSSLGVEAQAIGHSTTFLLADPRDKFTLPIEDAMREPIGHGLLEARVWHALAAAARGEALVMPDENDTFTRGADYVRSTLDAWAYSALVSDSLSWRSRKLLLPGPALSQEEERALVGHMLGSDTPLSTGEGLRMAGERGVYLEFAERPLDLGDSVDAVLHSDAGSVMLRSGFHPPEGWGRWSSRRLATIGFALRPDAINVSCLDIRLAVTAFEGLLDTCPVLRISYEGRLLALAFFRPGSNHHHLSFEVLPRSANVVLDLEFTASASPSDVGTSQDRRRIGFGVTHLSATLRPTDEELPVPTARAWGISPGSIPISHVPVS